jgi:hypothetical protein
LKEHETFIFHSGEPDPNPLLFFPLDGPVDNENHAGAAAGFTNLQPARFANTGINVTFEEKSAQTEVARGKISMRTVAG